MKYVLNNQETERLFFRPIMVSDLDAWLTFFKDPSSFRHWVATGEAPEVACKEWYTRQFQRYENDEGGMSALIEKETKKLIGHCGLLVQTVDNKTELEIGYSLLPRYRGKGFATEAARKCRNFAFGNNFTDSLISIISLSNNLSANVATKNGMTMEKQTIYKEVPVNIYRITHEEWTRLNCN